MRRVGLSILLFLAVPVIDQLPDCLQPYALLFAWTGIGICIFVIGWLTYVDVRRKRKRREDRKVEAIYRQTISTIEATQRKIDRILLSRVLAELDYLRHRLTDRK